MKRFRAAIVLTTIALSLASALDAVAEVCVETLAVNSWAKLLVNGSVQEELELSEAQIMQIETIYAGSRYSPETCVLAKTSPGCFKFNDAGCKSQIEAAREFGRRIDAVFRTQQFNRLKQISWQERNGHALLDREITWRLDIKEEQIAALMEALNINCEVHKELMTTIQRIRFHDESQMRKFIEPYIQNANNRLLDVLTVSQVEQFEILKGEPFLQFDE